MREEYVTIWTTFLLGGVVLAGWTDVAGPSRGCEPMVISGIDFADCELAGLCSSRPAASEWVASERKESLLLLCETALPLAETAVEVNNGRRELLPAKECGRRELVAPAFRAGSMITAFSMHISWVYELNLFHSELSLCRKRLVRSTLGQFSWHSCMAQGKTCRSLLMSLPIWPRCSPGCAIRGCRLFRCPVGSDNMLHSILHTNNKKKQMNGYLAAHLTH